MKWEKALALLVWIAVNGVFLHSGGALRPGFFALALLLCEAAAEIHLIAHELGHLAGGLASGYRLVFLRIGPLLLPADRQGKISLRIEFSRGGQCVMAPLCTEPVRYLRYHLGGSASNVLVCAVLTMLLAGRSLCARLFLLEVLLTGGVKVWQNLCPRLHNGRPSDGYTLRALGRSALTRRDYALYLTLYRALFLGEEVSRDAYTYERVLQGERDDLLYYREMQRLLEEKS